MAKLIALLVILPGFLCEAVVMYNYWPYTAPLLLHLAFLVAYTIFIVEHDDDAS